MSDCKLESITASEVLKREKENAEKLNAALEKMFITPVLNKINEVLERDKMTDCKHEQVWMTPMGNLFTIKNDLGFALISNGNSFEFPCYNMVQLKIYMNYCTYLGEL